jgi:hypothetical protein
LVPISSSIEPECDDALRELERRGFVVRKSRGFTPIDVARNQMAADALADGFDELIWVDPNIGFHPDDVEQLRRAGRPVVCGIYPKVGRREFACSFLPGTQRVTVGLAGGLLPVLYAAFGFMLTRKEVFDGICEHYKLPALNRRTGHPIVPYFATIWVGEGDDGLYLAEDYAFCERARQAGFEVIADTRIRLWHVGRYAYSWEDIASEKERHGTCHFNLPASRFTPPAAPAPKAASPAAAETGQPFITPHPDPGPLRTEHLKPLPAGFPKLRLYVMTYAANAECLALTLKSIRESDWGDEAVVVCQPADWPTGKEPGSRNYKRILDRALADGCDFAVILEDDVRVGRHLRHNLLANPLVKRDVCDYLGLFMPDLIAAPWERAEPHLGYRLAKPLYAGPNALWEKHRVWGSQGYCLSRQFLRAAADRWDRLRDGQDARVLGVCAELNLPLWYTMPSLVEHAPLRSAYGTPIARAADFDPAHRLEVKAGFQPPDGVPGWLTINEGRALFEAAAEKSVLEMGTACGRATVCLAQSASRLVSVDIQGQETAAEWSSRFGVASRVEFLCGSVADRLKSTSQKFGLAFVDTEHDEASVRRDLELARGSLAPQGLIAVHDYPDPGWPDVRRVVDEYAERLEWIRIEQRDYLAVFQISSSSQTT